MPEKRWQKFYEIRDSSFLTFNAFGYFTWNFIIRYGCRVNQLDNSKRRPSFAYF